MKSASRDEDEDGDVEMATIATFMPITGKNGQSSRLHKMDVGGAQSVPELNQLTDAEQRKSSLVGSVL